MLKKNKDYVEFTLQYTSVDWERRSKDCPEVCLKGYSDFSFPGVPIMDVVCNEFDHKVVVVSKRDFEKMQADVNINAEIAKQWEINYDLLLKKIGFDTVEELVNYLNSEAECDTLREAIASLEYSVKFARDERRDLSKKLDECEKDYISERDKAEKFQTENKELKQKLHGFDPTPEFKELLKNLYSIEDVEKLEWFLNHVCGGLGSATGWRSIATFWKNRYNDLFKLIGFSAVEEIEDYLVNEAECDTLHEAIYKLIDESKHACEKWCNANSSNNSWKAAAECNTPKELIEKRETIEKEIEVYSRALQEWKEGTGCPGPIAAKALIESGMAYEHGYHEAQEENRKLEEENADLYAEIRKWKDSTKCEKPEAAATWITSYESACERGNRLAEMVEKLKEEVYSWKNVTGYSTPEDYMHARISGAFHTPFDYTAAWRKATGCDTPDQVKSHIEGLENAVRLTNRNMIKEIERAIDEWQTATGCVAPEKAQYKITDLYNRIDKMKEAASIASNWMDKIVEG